MEEYLNDTIFLDFKNPEFDVLMTEIDLPTDPVEKAIALYYHVRDGYLYDPYHLDLTEDGLKCSRMIKNKRAWCVQKAALLAALARKNNIPSRLGYAIVTNHIGIDKLTQYLRREEIVFHGFTELFLDGKWVKCTPAFDKRVCRLSGVTPLEWDGKTDSLFQEFENGKRFMEYSHFYGTFNDIPIDLMNSEMKRFYPHLFEGQWESQEFSFKGNNQRST